MPSASEDELVLLDKECATLAETLASKQVGSNIEISLFNSMCVSLSVPQDLAPRVLWERSL